MLKHTLGVSLVSVICFLFELTLPNAAWAATPDYTCYIQIGSGQVVDLTHTVCRSHSEKAAEPPADNAVYLSSVKKLVKANDTFLELIDSNPELIIAAAQNYCAARRSGMSEQQYVELQHEELISTLSESSTVDDNSEKMKQYQTRFRATAVAVEFAPSHYCPGIIRR